jgi:hypothetical protein
MTCVATETIFFGSPDRGFAPGESGNTLDDAEAEVDAEFAGTGLLCDAERDALPPLPLSWLFPDKFGVDMNGLTNGFAGRDPGNAVDVMPWADRLVDEEAQDVLGMLATPVCLMDAGGSGAGIDGVVFVPIWLSVEFKRERRAAVDADGWLVDGVWAAGRGMTPPDKLVEFALWDILGCARSMDFSACNDREVTVLGVGMLVRTTEGLRSGLNDDDRGLTTGGSVTTAAGVVTIKGTVFPDRIDVVDG